MSDYTRLQNRAKMLSTLRTFFLKRNVLEVDLPYLIPYAQIDAHIDPISTNAGFLHTSPEYTMKKLIAKIPCDIYQIAHVFRAEEKGANHTIEFSMIEWYRMGFSYDAIIEETLALIQTLLGEKKVTFVTFAKLWEHVPKNDPRKEELLFDTFVLPEIKSHPLLVVMDYPVSFASLAAVENNVAKRFEIYAHGLELANGFLECRCKQTLENRFKEQNSIRKQENKQTYTIDQEFLEASAKMPPCAGVSVGFDRICKIVENCSHIEDIHAIKPSQNITGVR